jgi:multiple sugar transport system permease protein
MTNQKRDWWVAYAFLAPALIGLLVFRIYPIALAVWGSLHQSSFIGATGKQFVGLQNYSDLLSNSVFWTSVWVTLKLNLIINPLQITLALLLAVLANQKFRGIFLYRTIFFIPIGVSTPISAIIWRIMVEPNNGLANAILMRLGIPPQPFLTSADQALATVIVVATWTGISFWMVFLLAGLQSIPADLHEAAMLDGASAIERFFHITLPLMKRPILFVLATDTAINFLLFSPIYLLTRGGPSLSTNTLMYESFKTGFVYGDMGSGLAMVIVLLVMVLITVGIEFRMLRSAH